MKEKTQNLCQPDRSKGCSACCGLLNFKDLSRPHLSRFLNERNNGPPFRQDDMIAPESGHSDQLRDPTAYVCPHQGLLSGARPGCLVHPLGATVSGRNESLFGEKICDSFLCPAHTVLNEDQKKKIVAHIHDWYYYSFAIADPASLQWFLAVLSARFNADPGNGEILEKALFAFLEIHVRYLIATPGPIFFYSVPEYNIGRKNFCLASDAPHLDGEKNEILEAIAKVL